MHNIDQVPLGASEPTTGFREYEDELEFESGYELAAELGLEHEDEFEHEHEHEFEDEHEHEHEYEDEFEDEFEDEYEDEARIGGVGEAGEVELAAQLLEVGNETELEQFLGDLLRAASGAAADFARSREGRQLGGMLKSAAGRVLPVLGQAAGRAVGGAVGRVTGASPARARAAGARVGANLGAVAKKCFGLELEGSSPEDQEYEVARRFVRFADAAVRECLRQRGTGPARHVAQQALRATARRLAPGLVTERTLAAPPLPRWSGAVSASRARTAPTASARRPTTGAAPTASARRPTTASAPSAARRPTTGAAPSAAPRGTNEAGCTTCGAGPVPGRGRWERRGNTIVLFGR